MIINDAAVYPLFEAIVKRAVTDYVSVCRHGEFGPVSIDELNKFFYGPLFAAGSGNIDPDALLQKIRRGDAKAKPSLTNIGNYKLRNEKGCVKA